MVKAHPELQAPPKGTVKTSELFGLSSDLLRQFQ
jgi:hypothetical protein